MSPLSETLPKKQEKIIKPLLKLFKRLETALGKFDGKQNGITKTNVLRTVVLPFLRLLPPLHSLLKPDSKLYLSFASISTSVLGLWWRLLLSCLSATGVLQISATDRSAYLECISRIFTRMEWLQTDSQATETYTACLTDTLDFSISRLLSLKVVPVSISAFVGKVFAYSFFYLPGACNALLFLLNVKQKILDKLSLAFLLKAPGSKTKAVSVFPQHVIHLIDYKGLQNLERVKRGAINCVAPPRQPVKGIRDPSGPWVRRWCTGDIDIFNAFFRHYINIVHASIENSSIDPLDVPPSLFPGFRVVTSFIYQIILVSINRILHPKAAPNIGLNTQHAPSAIPLQILGSTKRSASGSGIPSSSLPFKQTDSNYASITKIFRSVRDISYSLISFSNTLTGIVDRLLADIAKSIGLYDVNKTSFLLNLVYEYSIHVLHASDMDWEFWLGCCYLMLTNTYHVQIITRNFAFLFNVWDKIPNLLDGGLARSHYWLVDPSESMKVNFSNWLTSSSVWILYFPHWNPLVRSHYLRLLAWRVIGFNNFETSSAVRTTCRIKQKSDFIFDELCKILAADDLPSSLTMMDFTPDLPIVNRKFGIVPINQKNSYMEGPSSLVSVSTTAKHGELRKTHPYEILDEAVYTCTSLPISPGMSIAGDLDSTAQPDMDGDRSIIDSLSRFFKLMSTDDATGRDSSTMAPPKGRGSVILGAGVPGKRKLFSKSMTSLSLALSMKSISSSTSISSFQSSPNSANDQSTESSITSDSESSLSDCAVGSSISTSSSNSLNNQPPELIKILPEIVRPTFKLEIVLDHGLASSKCSRMQESKCSWNGRVFYGSETVPNLSYTTLPKPPKIPSVSIFLNSDAYNKFFITREDYQVGEEVLTSADHEDFKVYFEQMTGRLRDHTKLATLGKALNEWNAIVDEFESYLFDKVEADQINYLPIVSDGAGEAVASSEISEEEYFTRIIPLLPIDNFTELKLLNAS
ncbi:DUF1765-domain-containing protein [Metschnikowia bicuspidata var. bicuspidata NRRL YB-4993]|uniref:DUF1765-domain-containing protein n=1 Tax=Metschnikowia bicuspidata var. bicuspidata NRRL YB-4993 TaxID=869754 RepID=A0A1A0H668_9ASCO|nr:DUF1765-domain-containing protein [Metschnikowia bicuspidata var. bicuspidata NRRL YB-4993]OBA19402.1 DUF1765-domain-containing protein [Metschnikowia bicuspidata var. bicuspidata NRRL YB-4993]